LAIGHTLQLVGPQWASVAESETQLREGQIGQIDHSFVVDQLVLVKDRWNNYGFICALCKEDKLIISSSLDRQFRLAIIYIYGVNLN
jgi:hypothetical protein